MYLWIISGTSRVNALVLIEILLLFSYQVKLFNDAI